MQQNREQGPHAYLEEMENSAHAGLQWRMRFPFLYNENTRRQEITGKNKQEEIITENVVKDEMIQIIRGIYKQLVKGGWNIPDTSDQQIRKSALQSIITFAELLEEITGC
ncbi:MAG: hypothetical protein AABX86_00095, partial [Nanoarchaeota archaeon]